MNQFVGVLILVGVGIIIYVMCSKKKEGMCCGASAISRMVGARNQNYDLITKRMCPDLLMKECKNYPYSFNCGGVIGPGSGCGISKNLECHFSKRVK